MNDGVQEVLAGGGPKHEHLEPMAAYKYRWNTVVRSTCGHLYVRRYTWGQMLIPLYDHFPTFVRLRPWHVMANLSLIFKRKKTPNA